MKLVAAALAAASGLVLSACSANDLIEPVYAQAPGVCSGYGLADRDNNSIISQAEWVGFGTGAFPDWDVNDDSLIDRTEFQNCWTGAGFRNDAYFDTADWDDNFSVFDDDGDGFLGPNEFFADDEFGMFDSDDDFGIEPGIGEWGF